MLGFENVGNIVTDRYANHVLVLMLKGICKKCILLLPRDNKSTNVDFIY